MRLLQYLHSIAPGQSLPLIYPEGLLFPRIFYKAEADGSVVGALPSVMYSDYGSKHRLGGFASLVDHLNVRLRDWSSLTSKDPQYISFLFDVFLNHVLNHNSITVAVKKGLEHITRVHVEPVSREASLKFDEIDSRKNVRQLSGMMRQQRWTYFLTLTCNDSGTMGVSPIRKAVGKMHPPGSKAYDEELQNQCVLSCQAWERTVRYFFDYLLNSDEKPCGDVIHYWYRFEFQDKGALGNKPHVHAGLTLNPDTLDEKKDLARIANKVAHMFTVENRTDLYSLVDDGLIKDDDEFLELYILAKKFTRHDCGNAKGRCMKKRSATDKVGKCRVPRHPASFEAQFHPHPQLYSREAMAELKHLGLTDQYGLYVHPDLVGGRYTYPADPCIVSVPTNPRIFAAFKSMVNFQKCDNRFQTAYMCKYVAGVDEKRDIIITSKDDKSTKEVIVTPKELFNAKITGAANAEKEQRRKEGAGEPLAREISLTEMVWFCLGLPYVRTDVEFVEISTHAPEYRHAVYKHSDRPSQKFLHEDGSLKAVGLREDLNIARQFSPEQIIHMTDAAKSCYFVDRTTAFSLRPPELLMFGGIEQYYTWFSNSPCEEFLVSEDISATPWIDGRCNEIRIRQPCLPAVLNYLQGLYESTSFPEYPDQDHARLIASQYHLVELLMNEMDERPESDLFKRFVDSSKTKQVIIAFSQVTPEQWDKYMVHVLLSLGIFNTELDLYNGDSWVTMLQNANIIPRTQPGEWEARVLTRRLIMEQLQFLPISTKKFSRLFMIVLNNLRTMFAGRAVAPEAMPLASHRAIKLRAERKLLAMETTYQNNLVHALEDKGLPPLPDLQALRERRLVEYDPHLVQIEGQTDESYQEQQQALTILRNAIDEFVNPGKAFVRCPIVIGPPGAGKTHLLLTACVYSLSKKLRTMITAYTSERARMLGGEHMHLLFGLPVAKCHLETPNVTAEKCLKLLALNQSKTIFIQRLDVVIFEEIGLLPVHLLVVLDLVLRNIRNSPVPYGGLLIIASGDPRQLPPIEGTAIWTSVQLLTTFQVLQLEHFVRSRNDVDLQNIIILMRKPVLSEDDVAAVLAVLRRRCVPLQFVSSWDEVPVDMLRVVSTRCAEKKAVGRFIVKMLNTPGIVSATYSSVDTVETMSGNWGPGDQRVRDQLDRLLSEPAELLLFVGATMRLTYNNSVARPGFPRFSQGQLCVISRLPDAAVERDSQRIEARLVPPGFRDVNAANIPPEWERLSIKRRQTIDRIVGTGMTKGRRYQWPLRYFVANTIHKVMGETCSRLATQISLSDKSHSLWQPSQLLTLVSRVQSIDDIVFVGDVQDTFTAMEVLLRTTDPCDVHVETLMNRLNVLKDSSRQLTPDVRVFSPMDCEIPSLNCGFAYMVVSSKFTDRYQLGETLCIGKRLHALNSSFCATADLQCRPWVLMALVFGFSDDKEENTRQRQEFEYYWRLCDYGGVEPNTRLVLMGGTATQIFFKRQNPDVKLVFKQCCDFVNRPVRPDRGQSGQVIIPTNVNAAVVAGIPYLHESTDDDNSMSSSSSNDDDDAPPAVRVIRAGRSEHAMSASSDDEQAST